MGGSPGPCANHPSLNHPCGSHLNFSSQSVTDSDADPAIQHDFARRSSPEGSRPQKALQNSKSKKSKKSKEITTLPLTTHLGALDPVVAQGRALFLFFFDCLDFGFWCAFWGRDPSGELRLEKSCWMAGSASESVTLCVENLRLGFRGLPDGWLREGWLAPLQVV